MRFFLKALNAEKGEGISAVLFLFLGIFSGGLAALVEVTSITMFIKSWKSEYFPLAFLLAGLSGIIVSHFYTKLQNWVPLSALAFFSLSLLFIGDLFIFYSYRINPTNWILYVGFVFASANMVIPFQIFWGFFNKIYDTLQTRRLSTRIEAGLIFGAVMSLLSVSSIVSDKNPEAEYLYLLAALLTAGAGIIVIAFSFKFSIINKITSNVQYINARNNYPALIRNSYLRSIVIFAFLSGLSLGLVDFIFYSIVTVKYDTTPQTIVYLSNFFAILTLLGYIISLTLTNRINNKYGYMISLLILPGVLTVFVLVYSFISFRFGFDIRDDSFYLLFMIMAICKMLYMILFRGFEFTTFRAYFIPVETELRFDFQNRAEGFFRQFGKMMAGGFAFLCLSFFMWKFANFSWLLAIVTAVWIAATYKMHQWYRITLKDSLETGDIVLKEDRKISSYIDELVYTANKIESHNLSAHLNILNILNPIQYKNAIESLLDSEDDNAQRIALYQAGDLCLLAAIDVLENVQKSKYYTVSRNRELIRRIFNKLRGSEFRLEKIKYIEQLTFSKITSERRFGALLATYSDNSMKPKLLNKLFRDVDYKVRYNAVTASAKSRTTDLHNNMIEKLADQGYSNAAVAAIEATGESMFPLLESAFHLTGQTEKVQLRIIQIYGRIATEKSVELLTKKLNYTNQNIIAATIDALSRSGVTIAGDKSIQFRREIEEVCQVLVWNMSAYNDLSYHKNKASDLLLLAMKSEIQYNYDSLFKLLALLYDTKSVSLVKENINSGDPDKTEFASELLEVFVAEEIKPMLLPIISVDSYETIVYKMQEYFPAAPMTFEEVLYDLIQRDYKWVNRWTKACALQELAQSGKFDNPDIFLANLVNPDALLRETAAVLLFKMDKSQFKNHIERFKQDFNYQSGREIISKNILSEIAEHGHSPALKFEMIRFLNQVNEFKEVPGIILMELAKVMELTNYKKQELIDRFESFDYFDYFLVQEGIVLMKINGKPVHEYKKGSFIHALNYINTEQLLIIELEALENCAVYKMQQEVFHELISYHEEIPKAILKNQFIKELMEEPSL
jgi:AAA family ATP:ADP antiporter